MSLGKNGNLKYGRMIFLSADVRSQLEFKLPLKF